MKPNATHFDSLPSMKYAAGLGLLDVVLAIAVFAFGMLALVQLQGNLGRSSADANMRTVAANLAEELVERVRALRSVEADGANGVWDYLELNGAALNAVGANKLKICSLPQGVAECAGDLYEFERTVTIFDFWWDEANDTFVRTANTGTEPPEPPEGLEYLAYSDFKLLRLDVSWNNSEEFYVDDSDPGDGSNTADLGSGNITVYEVIPSAPPILGARLSAESDDDGGLDVRYTPGELPDIVQLTLDGDKKKFKETTTPLPRVIRTDELAETWFDVVTYNGTGNDAVFLRREEFALVSCECELQAADNGDEGGFRPTLWNGYDYTEGEFVQKNHGATSDGSSYCVTCCRDHHDGGDGENDTDEVEALIYDPWNAPNQAPDDDHPHYTRDRRSGELVEADIGDEYVEACRMVRKDGFMRVTHDLNQKALVAVPEDYLDETSEVTDYSAYVIESVTDYVEDFPTSFDQPTDMNPAYVIPASTKDNATALPAATGGHDARTDTQQLRSRGIYVDYPTLELRANLANCPGDTCIVPGFTRDEEMYPFFELQLTWLANWREKPFHDPVEVTMMPIETDNVHSRGVAELQPGGVGQSEVLIDIHKGNIGLTGTDPIVPADLDLLGDRYARYSLFVDTAEGEPPPVPSYTVDGVISETVGQGFKATSVAIEEGSPCNRTATGYTCDVPKSGGPYTVTFIATAAHKGNSLSICAVGGELTAAGTQTIGSQVFATFTLPSYAFSAANVVVQKGTCN